MSQTDKSVTRREFLGTGTGAAAGVAAGLSLGSLPRGVRAQGANERFTIALIGCGGMGRYKLGNFMDSERVNVAAVCDPDDAQMQGAAQQVEEHEKVEGTPKQVKNYKDVLDMKDIDLVIIGTPDHWHAPMMMNAVSAGKHVYCEKPCSHNILEAKLMVEAAKKHGKVVQVGTHQRSIPHIQEARNKIMEGKLGTISQTHTYTYGNESPDGMGKPSWKGKAPDGVDYDLWLGPAPVPQEPDSNRFHKTWRWFFDYAAGMVGDWNVHLQDIVMWTMDIDAPISVNTTGGIYVLEDGRTTPDTMQTVYEFGPCKLAPKGFTHTFTMRKASGPPWNMVWKGQSGHGMDFFGTNGSAHLDRRMYEFISDPVNWKADLKDLRMESERERDPGGDFKGHPNHVSDMLDCIVNDGTPIASIEKHYHTVVACHLANVSYRAGRQIFWDAEKVMCFKDRELKMADEEANAYLTREYRKGYELPAV